MRAYVFVRYNSGDGAGHVAWGFELPDGRVCVGSVENHSGHLFTPASSMGFWCECRTDFTAPIRNLKYDDLCVFEVGGGNYRDAYGVTKWIEHSAYHAIARNCEDDVYDVLRMYGVQGLEAPFFNWFPRWWFGRLKGRKMPITAFEAEPAAPRTGNAEHTDPESAPPLRPPWRNPLHVATQVLNAAKLVQVRH